MLALTQGGASVVPLQVNWIIEPGERVEMRKWDIAQKIKLNLNAARPEINRYNLLFHLS